MNLKCCLVTNLTKKKRKQKNPRGGNTEGYNHHVECKYVNIHNDTLFLTKIYLSDISVIVILITGQKSKFINI